MPFDSGFDGYQMISFLFYGLPPSSAIKIELPSSSESRFTLVAPGFIEWGTTYTGQIEFAELIIRPRRIVAELTVVPQSFLFKLQMPCTGPFLEGNVQVPNGVQITIASAVERIRIFGPGYWAIPILTSAPNPRLRLEDAKQTMERPEQNAPATQSVPALK